MCGNVYEACRQWALTRFSFRHISNRRPDMRRLNSIARGLVPIRGRRSDRPFFACGNRPRGHHFLLLFIDRDQKARNCFTSIAQNHQGVRPPFRFQDTDYFPIWVAGPRPHPFSRCQLGAEHGRKTPGRQDLVAGAARSANTSGDGPIFALIPTEPGLLHIPIFIHDENMRTVIDLAFARAAEFLARRRTNCIFSHFLTENFQAKVRLCAPDVNAFAISPFFRTAGNCRQQSASTSILRLGTR